MDHGSYSFLDFTLDPATERLLHGSAEIKLRPKSFQVLHYLVEHHGRLVTRDELLQGIWGGVAVTDESVTKCIAEVRRALADESQEIVRTVTRRGFLFQAQVRLVEPRPNEAQGPNSAPRVFAVRRTVLVAGFAAIGVSLVLVAASWRGHLFGRRPIFEAIAVLPFESLSKDSDQQYIADGMTEALITDLGQASPLRVIARTSVNQYLKAKKPIRVIARELNVDVVVEGTVAQSGDAIRVTANLIQVSPERHIWSHSYEREFRDVLALQNEIAGAIAGEVQSKVTLQQQSRPRDSHPVKPEAQLAYWKARRLLDNAQGDLLETYRKAIQYSEQAVRIDPYYAAAHAGLAWAYAWLSNIGAAFPREVMPRAEAEARRAVELDEGLAYAHFALGYLLLTYHHDWAGAEREGRRAVALNPSDAEAHWLVSDYLAAVGHVAEAVDEMKRARELDPLSFHMNWSVGRILCLARKYDEALAELHRTGDMQPNSSAVDIWIFKSHWMKGQVDDAIAADLRIRGYRDGFSMELLNALRSAYLQKGSRGYWAKLREVVLPRFRTNPIGWYRLAEINTYLGNKEEALRWLEKAFEERPEWIPFLKVDPTLDPLRSDPRFSTLLERMGLAH